MTTPEPPVTLPEAVKALLETDDNAGATRLLMKMNPRLDRRDAMHAIMHHRMSRHHSGAFLKHLVYAQETIDKRPAPRRRIMAWLLRCLLLFAAIVLASWLMRN